MKLKTVVLGGILAIIALGIGAGFHTKITGLLQSIGILSANADSTITVSSGSLHARTACGDKWTCDNGQCTSISADVPITDVANLHFGKDGSWTTYSVTPGWTVDFNQHGVKMSSTNTTVTLTAGGNHTWGKLSDDHYRHSVKAQFKDATLTNNGVTTPLDCGTAQDCVICWGAHCN